MTPSTHLAAVWFPLNQAVGLGATAFVDRGNKNRYANCYIDCSTAIFYNPTQTTWVDGIILGGRGIELAGALSETVITGNVFLGGRITYTGPANATPVDTVIASNTGGHIASTTSTLTLRSLKPQAQWFFDFCDQLVFPKISKVLSVTVASAAPNDFPVAVARQPRNCTLVVAVKPPCAGVVTVTVDTSL